MSRSAGRAGDQPEQGGAALDLDHSWAEGTRDDGVRDACAGRATGNANGAKRLNVLAQPNRNQRLSQDDGRRTKDDGRQITDRRLLSIVYRLSLIVCRPWSIVFTRHRGLAITNILAHDADLAE